MRDSSGETVLGVLKGRFPSFQTPRPDSARAWEQQKPALRKRLWRLLGDLPEPLAPIVTVDGRQSRDGYTREHFTFDNGAGDAVYGYVLIPAGAPQRRPAILYHHYHGDRYEQGKEELFVRAFAGMGNDRLVTGEELVRRGYVVLAIDAYCFGQRRFQGPAGDREDGAQTEVSLFKTFLWQGRTLWGMMVRDDLLALNYLLSRPEVDPQRIAALGMSMGATRTWWLAALDDRIQAAVSVACLTRYQDLIAAGDVRYHGIYYYVPGVLGERIDAEGIVGLIAPRAHLTLTGDRDRGSPTAGVRTINAFQEHLYQLYGKADRFRGVLYPGVGHEYTPEMWRETLNWLEDRL
jgi:hypothetical protein